MIEPLVGEPDTIILFAGYSIYAPGLVSPAAKPTCGWLTHEIVVVPAKDLFAVMPA